MDDYTALIFILIFVVCVIMYYKYAQYVNNKSYYVRMGGDPEEDKKRCMQLQSEIKDIKDEIDIINSNIKRYDNLLMQDILVENGRSIVNKLLNEHKLLESKYNSRTAKFNEIHRLNCSSLGILG